MPAPTISSFSAGSSTISAGGSTTLMAVFTGGTGAVNNSVGAVTTGTPVTVSPAATTTYTLTVTNAAGTTVTATTTVTVVAVPVATSLVASTASPAFGGTFTLTPSYSGGTGTIDSGVACPASGVATSAIPASWSGPRTYTLTVTNAAGTTALTTVTVTPQATIVGPISPAAPTLTAGTSVGFSAAVSGGSTNALSWSATGGGTWSGTTWAAPAAPGSYTITATSLDDPTKSVTTTATVVAAPSISTFTAGASTLTAGDSTTLTAVFANGTGTVNNSVGAVTSAVARAITPAATTTYTLTVTNAAGTAVTTTATVTVVPVPLATSLSASTLTPAYGATFTLTPTYSAGTGTLNHGVTCPASGAASVPLTADWSGARTYTLTVTNAAGTAVTSTVTVVVNPLVAAPAMVTAGATGYTASVPAQAGSTYVWTVSPGTITGGQGSNSVTWTAPATASGVVTISCVITYPSGDPTTVSTTAAVVAAPTGSLTASSTNPPCKATNVTVTPTWGTSVVSAKVGTTVGGSDISASAPSGTAISLQPSGFIMGTTYTLTVTNAAGTTADYSVTITPQTVGVGAITPAAPTRTIATPTTFSTTVTGGATNGVGWSSTAGTWAGSTWTAPAAAQTVTITATSVDDPSRTATTTVTVVAVPVATSLVPSNATPYYGSTFTLTPLYSNGTGTIDYSVACPDPGAPSGLITANWADGRTYTLTVTNAAGTTATTSTVVTPIHSFAIQNFAATPDVVPFGGSTTLSWLLSGSAPTALTLDGADVLGTFSATVTPRLRQAYTLSGTAWNADSKTTKVAARGLDLLAGSAGGPGYLDGPAALARYNNPNGVAMDSAGNLYVADTWNHTIRKLTVDGSGNYTVTTLAGQAGSLGLVDGSRSAARFYCPTSLAVDGVGNVYVADTYNNALRKITPSGEVITIANELSISDTGVTSGIVLPSGVAVDASGNVYSSEFRGLIKKLIPNDLGGSYTLTTLAGSVATAGSLIDGKGAAAGFHEPLGVAIDRATHTLYVADHGNHAIRMITPGGMVSTYAGSIPVKSGSKDGAGTGAMFNGPSGLAFDSTSGTVYVADFFNHAIRKIAPGAVVTTLAGVPSGNWDFQDGPEGLFYYVTGVAAGPAGTVYVADPYNEAIRKVTAGGVVATFSGYPALQGETDGPGVAARFRDPRGVAVDGAGNTYVTETLNQLIRKITPTGVVRTIAGTGGISRIGATDGPGREARFNRPEGLAADVHGTLYVADSDNHTIRKLEADEFGDYTVSTLAGEAGFGGLVDGPGTLARFNYPKGVAVSSDGNLYVADTGNHTIRKITPTGEVSTLAGTPGVPGFADGIGASAQFSGPWNIGVDSLGNVYVSDSGNHTIRKLTPDSLGNYQVSTLAGTHGLAGSTDETGAAARFHGPQGLAVDGSGTVYVVDFGNNTIRKVTGAGAVTTVVGVPGPPDYFPGPLPGHLNKPKGVAVTPDGDLIITQGQAVVQVTAP